jgi:hypothetical protein
MGLVKDLFGYFDGERHVDEVQRDAHSVDRWSGESKRARCRSRELYKSRKRDLGWA